MKYLKDVLLATCVAILIWILCGCSTVPETPEVQVPVAVPCSALTPAVPALKYNPGSYADVFSLVRDLKGDTELHLGYEAELLAALLSCTK